MILSDTLLYEIEPIEKSNYQSQKSSSISFETCITNATNSFGKSENKFFSMVQQKSKTGKKTDTILVIDDEESMQDTCSQVLSREGYEILTAFDAEHGISLIRGSRPDVILLDLKLPGKSGGEIIQDISSIDPTIVVVVITGYATIESAVEVMKLGSSDFLPKPFTPDELRMIVKRAMEKRNLLVETRSLQEENARIRENFVSVITHEMRSPLVVVEQYIEVLLGGFTGGLESKQLEILTQCKQRIKWLLALVNEWLEMARIQDTIILEKIEEVCIRSIVDEAIDIVRIQTEEKDIKLEFDIPQNLPSIMGNHEALVHLFMNLYSNAIKYNQKSGKVITCACDEGDSISIQVSDTGIGIPKEILPFVFDEFFRVSNIRKQARKTTNETGTGLGLAIVKKFVDAHKGYICVDSQENVGTIFTVHLPKKQPSPDNHKSSIH